MSYINASRRKSSLFKYFLNTCLNGRRYDIYDINIDPSEEDEIWILFAAILILLYSCQIILVGHLYVQCLLSTLKYSSNSIDFRAIFVIFKLLERVAQANIPLEEEPEERLLSDYVADIIVQHNADFDENRESVSKDFGKLVV